MTLLQLDNPTLILNRHKRGTLILRLDIAFADATYGLTMLDARYEPVSIPDIRLWRERHYISSHRLVFDQRLNAQ